MTDLRIELLEMAKRCEDRALYNSSGDPMALLKEAAWLMRRYASVVLDSSGNGNHMWPPAPRQENDDVFPGFRGNNDGG